MKRFDVLNDPEAISSSRLLEASAGTGKTFTIEHLVARYLLADPPVELSEILLVTFTRAAAAEMRKRIELTLIELVEALHDGREEMPSYLRQVDPIEGRRRLRRALYLFQDAQVFTLHGFCQRMLAEAGELVGGGTQLTPTDVAQLIRDVLNTTDMLNSVSPGQLDQLLRSVRREDRAFYKKIAEAAGRRAECASRQQLEQALQRVLDTLPCTLDVNRLYMDFCNLAPMYKGLCDRSNQPKPETLEPVSRFCSLLPARQASCLFDLLVQDGLSYCPDPATLKSRPPKQQASLNYPSLQERLREQLMPVVEQMQSIENIASCIGGVVQQRFETVCRERGQYRPDDLVSNMVIACGKPDFAAAVRRRYRTVVVDEFQDTDPQQWEIVRQLFLVEPGHHVYLVGDPKQSIYAFRNADIYTYLEAARVLGEERVSTLDTNYRSDPRLVEALNVLFASVSPFIPLPRLNTQLPYHAVRAGKQPDSGIGDGRGRIHFFHGSVSPPKPGSWPPVQAQEHLIFPTIAKEVRALVDLGVPFSDQAMLVRTQKQGAQLVRFLERHGIPAVVQSPQTVLEEGAAEELYLLLLATLRLPDPGPVRAALLGRVLGFTPTRLASQLSGSEESFLIRYLPMLTQWRISLAKGGICQWWRTLLDSCLPDTAEPIEAMLIRRGLKPLHADLTQLVGVVAEEAAERGWRGMELLKCFERLTILERNEDGRLSRPPSGDGDAVRILTLHMSKGLEFPVVYALGLLQRSPKQDAHELQRTDEEDAEKMRQLYVTLTRASRRVYVPVLFDSARRIPSTGMASPLELFLSHIECAESQQGFDYGLIASIDSDRLVDWIDAQTVEITHSGYVSECPVLKPHVEPIEGEDETQAQVFAAPFLSTSFSAQSRYQPHRPHPAAAHDVPGGVETGRVLHTLIQQLPWPQSPYSADWVIEWMTQRRGPWDTLRDHWQQLGRWVELLFSRKLLSNGLRLCDVPESSVWREVDFAYRSSEREVTRGVIDCVIQVGEDQYDVLDWKSHTLQPEAEESELIQLVEQGGYRLQAEIYRQAWTRHLKRLQRPGSTKVRFVFIRALEREVCDVEC